MIRERAITAAIALVLVSSSAWADTCTDSHDFPGLSANYGACIRSTVVRFERSGEAADSVATAAVVACRAQARLAATAYATCFDLSNDRMLDETEKQMHDVALYEVIDIRSRHHHGS